MWVFAHVTGFLELPRFHFGISDHEALWAFLVFCAVETWGVVVRLVMPLGLVTDTKVGLAFRRALAELGEEVPVREVAGLRVLCPRSVTANEVHGVYCEMFRHEWMGTGPRGGSRAPHRQLIRRKLRGMEGVREWLEIDEFGQPTRWVRFSREEGEGG